jgi:hypothetical protein
MTPEDLKNITDKQIEQEKLSILFDEKKCKAHQKDLDYGIWRYVLGATQASVKVEGIEQKIKIQPADAHPQSFVKLCRYLGHATDDVSALKEYLVELKKNLDQEIAMPDGIEPRPSARKYREALSTDDLQAIESECASVVNTVSAEPTPAPAPTPKITRRFLRHRN